MLNLVHYVSKTWNFLTVDYDHNFGSNHCNKSICKYFSFIADVLSLFFGAKNPLVRDVWKFFAPQWEEWLCGIKNASSILYFTKSSHWNWNEYVHDPPFSLSLYSLSSFVVATQLYAKSWMRSDTSNIFHFGIKKLTKNN